MKPRTSAIVAGVLAVLMVAAAVVALTVGGTSKQANAILGVAPQGLIDVSKAQPLPDLPATDWVNTPPLTPASLKGKVVFVDFWDASCINCRRTFPFLGKLASTYAADGLVILGVHSPEFAFEKSLAYVTRSAKELGVTWPVANDPEMAIWNNFQNQYWPAQYLVDRQGRVRLYHEGEGDDDVLEADVRALLAEDGGSAGNTLVGNVPTTELPGTQGVTQTPERYLGAERGVDTVGTVVAPGQTDARKDPAPAVNMAALTGTFTGAAEFVTGAVGSTVTLNFSGRDVYAVLAAVGPGAALDVKLNGAPVPAAMRGPDLKLVGTETELTAPPAADGGDLPHILTGPTGVQTSGVLTLTVVGAPVSFYTFTFGA